MDQLPRQLRFYLERHRGEDRGTLVLTGDDGPSVAPEELGLRVAAAGERYEATTPWGDPLAGEVWFRSEHQIGVTVDAWGDGLLVLVGRPAGGGMAILTTHGPPGEDADGLRAAWTTWWEQRGR